MIALDARYVRERPSGIGAMVDALVQRLPALLPGRRFLFLRHPSARRPLSEAPNAREVTLRAEANGPGTLLWLSRLVDLRGVELFHAPSNILPAGLLMPAITTIHDVMWLTHPELCRSRGAWGRVETAFYRHGLRRALRRSTALVAVSGASRQAIAAFDRDAADRTRVIPHGLDPAFRPAEDDAERFVDEAARARVLRAKVDRYVLAVGQAAGYKNHDRLLRAFLTAFADDAGVHLAFVQRLGDGARDLLRLAHSAGAADRVHVLPAVSSSELLALYRGALCLAHPSLVEGWGMPIGEALGSGCPVLTSDRSSMPEVTAGAAVLVDPESVTSIAEGLRRLAADMSLRARLVAAGRARAGELSWDEHARRTAGLYEEVLAAHRPGPVEGAARAI